MRVRQYSSSFDSSFGDFGTAKSTSSIWLRNSRIWGTAASPCSDKLSKRKLMRRWILPRFPEVNLISINSSRMSGAANPPETPCALPLLSSKRRFSMCDWMLASLDFSDAASFLRASTWPASVEESSMEALPQPTNRMAVTVVTPTQISFRWKNIFISLLPFAIASVVTSLFLISFNFSPGLEIFFLRNLALLNSLFQFTV